MSKLAKVTQNSPDDAEYTFYCPGCRTHHWFKTTGKEPRWTFNGNMEKPTVSPSIRVRGMQHCHFYIRDGKIEYLSDCDHSLAGKTIDMEEDDE